LYSIESEIQVIEALKGRKGRLWKKNSIFAILPALTTG